MELCTLPAPGGPLSPTCPLPITVTWARWEPSKMFAGTSRDISSATVGMEGNNSGHVQLLPARPHSTLAHTLPALTLQGLKAGLGHLRQKCLWTLVLGSSGLVALATSGQASLPHIPTALPDTPGQSYLPVRAGSCAPSPPGSPRLWGSSIRVGQEKGPAVSPRVMPAAQARGWVLSRSRSSHCTPRAAWTLSPNPSHFPPP